MQDDRRKPKFLTERERPAGKEQAKNWFPEIIEPDDVGRSYPAKEPFSLRAALRNLIYR